ncbi:MAG: hypothetical protein ACRERE_33125 [Candidatus Entotheonellia bacterium]
MPEREAVALRYMAIRESFRYHLQHNAFYRRYAEAANVGVDDLRDPEDLAKIPLVPEHLFKGCPGPDAFIAWLGSLSSDEITWPMDGIPNRSYDEQIALLNRDDGIQVESTGGLNDTASFLPSDSVTRRRRAHWNILTFFAMYPENLHRSERVSVTLSPRDFRWASLIVPEGREQTLLDQPQDREAVAQAFLVLKPRGVLERFFRRRHASEGMALLERLVERLKAISAAGAPGVLWAPASLLYALARFALEQNVGLRLGGEWQIMRSEGWQSMQDQPLSEAELRTFASQALGVPPQRIYDLYGVPEGLGLCALSCEEGYKHIPHTVVHPMVVSEAMEPLDDGMWGRFAFLNPLIQAFPGFIVTEHRVRLLRRCPACDRRGPVLDRDISPMHDGEDRSCGNMVRQIIAERLTT